MYNSTLPILLRRQVISMLLILLIGVGCDDAGKVVMQPIKFDQSKWNIKKDGQYTYRKQMIQDLLHRSKFIGMTRDSVIQMLGYPDQVQDDEIGYHYEVSPSPVNLGSTVSALVFYFEANNTVNGLSINDGWGGMITWQHFPYMPL